MANNAGVTAPNTPARNSGLPAELKSTPHAVGSAVVSEHIKTLGVGVNDVRPWIGRDVQNFKRCGADEILQQLLERCTDPSQPLPPSEKSMLLEVSLKAVLPICNGPGPVPQKMKKYLTEFCNAESERPSYCEFTQIANTALVALSKVNVPGMPAHQDDDETDILFHTNDTANISQEHQGKKSIRRPDVVVVSCKSAQDAVAEGQSIRNDHIRKYACKSAPKGSNFQWMNVRSTLEFKRPKKRIPPPPSAYKMDYVVPAVLHMEYLKETDASAQPTDSTSSTSTQPTDSATNASAQPTNSTPATGPAQTSCKASNEVQNISDRLRSSTRSSTKHRLDLGSTEPSSTKRSRRAKEPQSQEDEEKKKEPQRLHPVVQNGLYVAEMFAGHIARQHVISFIVNNDIIYLWWFDRQHTIQCAGINFVQDLPCFMVLLFIMQRMGYEQWGHHPLFEPTPGHEGEIFVEDKKKRKVDLHFDLKSKDRTTHFGLRGRATTLFPVKSRALSALPREHHFRNETTEFVAKLFWPEEARQSEPEILEEVYKIAKEDPDVLGHVPEMVWFHRFDETSTAIIRKALGIDHAGSRVLYIIVFRKLTPITTLSGDEFLLAWWEVVKCHRALWKRGVHHRDISPSNLMGYRVGGRFMSVLNDFDLSSILRISSSTRQGGPRGLERTGTVPFMALDLLMPEATAGEVEHLYYHDAESFIWVLTWVCLRYDKGELLRKGRPLDEWLTVDAIGCHEKKMSFLGMLRRMRPTRSHGGNFNVAMHGLAMILTHIGPFVSVPTDDEAVFLALQNHVPKHVLEGNLLSAQ
ncbi:hypothetical protein EDB19DRAFT_1847773 [Suillus lakei]|nr:hypothetical protein EDB19DRAFT_1847773 [Suillus lakei]